MDQAQWHREWSALDRRERARLRRMALRGRSPDDPADAALIAGFARDWMRREPLMRGLHILLLIALAASVVLKLNSGQHGLAAVFAALFVIDGMTLGLSVRTRHRLRQVA